MSNSTLATSYIPAADTNHWGKRKGAIKKIIVHHMAVKWTAKKCAESFAKSSRGASATYCIGYDGEIIRGLDESITPGTSGGYAADCDAVTIEVANSQSGGNWPVSDKALNSLIKLCADIAKRNKLGTLVKGKNLCWHQMYAATACPGPYLLSKMDYIAAEANKINAPFSGKVSGTDVVRGTDMLVVYANGLAKNGKTGTNKWGYEVAIDKNGIALENPHYSGNTTIPAGGKVLSGHGVAGTWIHKNIKKGYRVQITGGVAKVTVGNHKSVDGTNVGRGAEQIIVYNKKGSKTGTNKWGYEVAIDKDGKATSNPVYGVGNMAIPAGGFVVSGHNTAGTWIHKNIKKGKTVKFNGKYLTV
jgi:hypothetical protein